MYKVLFLCTGNSARSQMAELLLNRFGQGKYEAFSAGSNPSETVNNRAIEAIEKSGFDASTLRPKNMMEFIDQDFDFVITLCDKMKENCPTFPTKPIYAHWGMPDPVAFEGSDDEIRRCFNQTFQEISNRINLFLNIKIDKRDRVEIEKDLGEIASVWKFIR